MKIHIYKIYFPTSKKCYIGQTKDIKTRMAAHFKSGSLVCKALWKYDDWQIMILHTTRDKDTANLLEIEDIRNHNSVAPNGYNMTNGGDGNDYWRGKKLSAEHRANLSRAKKGKGLGNQNAKGNKLSKETREKMSKSRKGNQNAKGKHWKFSKETKEKISKSLIGNQRAKDKKQSKTHKLKRVIARKKFYITKLQNELNGEA